MDWIGSGLESKLIAWLEESGRDRYASEKSLDPFATSMRDFDDVSQDLITVSSKAKSDRARWGQRLTDLKSAGLLSDDRTSLSGLGQRTLADWQKYGVATHKQKQHELTRHLLLVIGAVDLKNSIILRFYEYWNELRKDFDPIELIENWHSLFAINFLDHQRSGFAPGKHLRDISVSIPELELGLSNFVVNASASQIAEIGAERIEQACAARIPRGRHRATFCMALEIAATNGVAAEEILAKFGYPKKVGQWKVFDDDEKALIRQIIKDHFGESDTDLQEVISDAAAEQAQQTTAPTINWDSINFADVRKPLPKPKKQVATHSKKVGSASKTDYAKKSEENKKVGDLGEQFALRYEAWRLREHPELVKRIEHVAATDDSLGYDIQSFNTDGSRRLVEVKATTGPLHSQFYITQNELAVAEKHKDEFVILRVAGLPRSPICCEITMPIDHTLTLTPSIFVCAFILE